MKFIKYYYSAPVSCDNVNLGDYVQTIAMENAISKLYDNPEFIWYNRDSLRYYNGEKAICVMQGWFSRTYDWLPSNDIIPVFTGTHFIEEIDGFLKEKYVIDELNKHTSIGCRDRYTTLKLKKYGVSAYLSRCLTLIFDKREKDPVNGKVFIIDVGETILSKLPKNIRNNAIVVDQREQGKGEGSFLYKEKYYDLAKKRLEEYKNEARLVITTAIHCAMPCIAMGIPVVMINPNDNASDFSNRYGAISDLINIYNVSELEKGLVDWNPNVVDIEPLKKLILDNLDYSINKAIGKNCDIDIDNVREEILNFKIDRSILSVSCCNSKNISAANTKNTWKEDFEYTEEMFTRISNLMGMVKNINSITSIMDLGCGKQQAKKYIDESIEYYPVDYINHIDSTIVKDFNNGEFYHKKVSLCLCSGILEYIRNINSFVRDMSKNCDYVLGSYNFKESFPNRNKIWVNNFSFNQLIKIFNKYGFVLERYQRGISKNDGVFQSKDFKDSADYYFLFRKKNIIKVRELPRIVKIKKFVASVPVIGYMTKKIYGLIKNNKGQK